MFLNHGTSKVKYVLHSDMLYLEYQPTDDCFKGTCNSFLMYTYPILLLTLSSIFTNVFSFVFYAVTVPVQASLLIYTMNLPQLQTVHLHHQRHCVPQFPQSEEGAPALPHFV